MHLSICNQPYFPEKKNKRCHPPAGARKKHGKMRRRRKEEEREVRRIVQVRLEENEQRKKARELRDRERYLDIVNAVVGHNGL